MLLLQMKPLTIHGGGFNCFLRWELISHQLDEFVQLNTSWIYPTTAAFHAFGFDGGFPRMQRLGQRLLCFPIPRSRLGRAVTAAGSTLGVGRFGSPSRSLAFQDTTTLCPECR